MRAIVLSRGDFKENDKMAVFLREDGRKMEVLARGAKKIISKNSSGLEPFTLVDLETSNSGNLLTELATLRVFPAIRADFQKSWLALKAAAILNKILRPEHKEPEYFFYFSAWLDFLEKTDGFSINFFSIFLWGISTLAGYRPVVDCCARCGGKNNLMFFSAAAGGAVCAKCAGSEDEKIDEKILDFIAKASKGKNFCSSMGALNENKIKKMAENFFFYHLDGK